ncbi:MAG: protein phosphatase 2C domain-containing protein [Verrucomicrobiales bacterium]|nr:protein phosphatase 2C domain-containing protein [Verrucomicrobiales bacterium]
MKIAKDGLRSIVRIGYDGRVYKTFRGTGADERFENEVKVLKVLDDRGCDYVPRLIDSDPETLTLVTTNCGHPADSISDGKAQELFDDLKENFGVIHDDPFPRNITYHPQMGRFCVIDFELAQVLNFDAEKNSDESGAFAINWFGVSIDGKRKPGNEDCLAAFASDDGWAEELPLEGDLNITERGAVFAVSDGMGGNAGGGYASWLAVKELRQFLPARMGRFEGNAEPLKHLALAVVDLNNYVNRIGQAKPDVKGMGATLVCGLFNRKEMHFAHVGDSRIYRFYQGELEQLTFDHTKVGEMERKGQINERQARSHPSRNVLYQAIGTGRDQVQPQVGTIHLERGMWFLFCSDGLIDGIWNNRIKNEFQDSVDKNRTPEETARAFLDESLRTSGKDDTTLMVVQVK